MLKSLRLAASVLVVAAALLAVASPALATPSGELRGRVESISSAGIVSKFLARLSQAVGSVDLQSLWASIEDDPDGEPLIPSGSDPAGGGATTQTGRNIDPDG